MKHRIKEWWRELPETIRYTVLTTFIPITLFLIWVAEGNHHMAFAWAIITMLWGSQVFYFQYGRLHEACKRAERDLEEWQERLREDNPGWEITFGAEDGSK